jgi:endonuclease/exonuclease/phosphatase family metal-dependent hydrolase
MKIIFLNTWNGQIKDKISDFLLEQSKDTEIFCLQETFAEMRKLAKECLPDFVEYYAYKEIDGDEFAQATYVHKKHKVSEVGNVLDGQEGCGLGLYLEISTEKGNLHLFNVHGAMRPIDKLDSPGRLKQSQGLLECFKSKDGFKIIGGDFNMLPDTQSMRMFAENGYRDMIREFGVKTTRNELAWAKYPDNPQYHADYVFLGPDVKLEHFSVVENEVSDHLPLVLEIGI